MALKVVDRVLETSTSTGVGAFTLSGARLGYRSFSSVCSVGDTFYYCIQGEDGASGTAGEWEVGLGTYSAANTLTRTSVHASSNAGAAVNFSAGKKTLWIDASAAFLNRGLAGALDAGNNNITGIKTACFNGQYSLTATSGTIDIIWNNGQVQLQAEPTGAITYTFTAPAGPCHLQLLIASDGTSTAQTITWPSLVKWIGATWAGAANKAAVINFYYDGTSYWAMGSNQV